MAVVFLDTNILLRHLRQDHLTHSKKATDILANIEQGKVRVYTSDIVIFETVFTLQRTYKVSKENIVASLLPLIQLPGINLPGKRIYKKVFGFYLSTSLGFADCYHIALMEKLKITEIFSFDSDFDKIENIKRKDF